MTKVSITDNIKSKDDLGKLYDFSNLPEPIVICSSGFSNSDPLMPDPLLIQWLSELLTGKDLYLILPNNSLYSLFDQDIVKTSSETIASDFSNLVLDLKDDWENDSFVDSALLQAKVESLDYPFENELLNTFSSKLWQMRTGSFISLAKLAPSNYSLANSLNLFPKKETNIEALNSLIVESNILVNSIFARSLAIREGVNTLAYPAENGEYEYKDGKFNTRDNRGIIVMGESFGDVDAISERLMGQDPEYSSMLNFVKEKLGPWDEMNLRRAKMLSLTII